MSERTERWAYAACVAQGLAEPKPEISPPEHIPSLVEWRSSDEYHAAMNLLSVIDRQINLGEAGTHDDPYVWIALTSQGFAGCKMDTETVDTIDDVTFLELLQVYDSTICTADKLIPHLRGRIEKIADDINVHARERTAVTAAAKTLEGPVLKSSRS